MAGNDESKRCNGEVWPLPSPVDSSSPCTEESGIGIAVELATKAIIAESLEEEVQVPRPLAAVSEPEEASLLDVEGNKAASSEALVCFD